MKPADLIMLIRQRSEWESVDLGFTLLQHVWRTLFPAWLLMILSAAAFCVLLIPEDYIWISGLLIWWIKPLFDRVLLHILSHNLFGKQLSIADVFSALPQLVRHTGLFSALTWRRFSFSRSYNLPIWQLEQLRGSALSERKELLYLQGHSAAVALTISCVLLELIIVLSLFALLIVFDPTGQAWEHLKGIFTGSSGSDMEYLFSLFDLSTQVIAIIIIEPFFVAAGFTLYLNRRTQLEAWDIEITFRSLGERLQEAAKKTAGGLLSLVAGLLVCTLTFSPADVSAATEEVLSPERLPVTETARQIEQVMQTEELNDRRKTTTWVPRDKSRQQEQTQMAEDLIRLIASIFKYAIWAIVLLAILLAVVYRHKILAMLTPPAKKPTIHEQPEVLFGMDIRPESLPADIAGQARLHWQQGEQREALSLLYRGALMQLTREDAIRIEDSHTEGDILRLAQPVLSESRQHYLQQITHSWQTIAYAHRTPDDASITPLFDGWNSFQLPAAPTAAIPSTPTKQANEQEGAG